MGALSVKAITLFCLICLSSFCFGIKPSWSWNWNTIHPFNFGVNYTGYDNETELLYKSNFPVLLIGWQVNNLTSSCCPGDNCSFNCAYESFQIKQATQYKQVISNKTVVFTYWSAFYLGFTESWAGRIANNPLYSKMFLGENPDLYGNAYNFSNETAVNWFLEEEIKAVAQSPFIDGIYLDSGNAIACNPNTTKPPLTYSERQILFNATVYAWKKAADYLTANNKYLTISLRNHFSNVSVNNTPFDCPYGEEVYYEIMGDTNWLPFRQYNFPSKDFGEDANGCSAAITDVSYYSSASGTLLVCHDKSFNTSLAAFLLGMDTYSYFGCGNDWDDAGWDYWWPDYNKTLGNPKGPFKKNGFQFTRDFEHASVFLDCSNLQSNITWLE